MLLLDQWVERSHSTRAAVIYHQIRRAIRMLEYSISDVYGESSTAVLKCFIDESYSTILLAIKFISIQLQNYFALSIVS